jgi:hypothetical protein
MHGGDGATDRRRRPLRQRHVHVAQLQAFGEFHLLGAADRPGGRIKDWQVGPARQRWRRLQVIPVGRETAQPIRAAGIGRTRGYLGQLTALHSDDVLGKRYPHARQRRSTRSEDMP